MAVDINITLNQITAWPVQDQIELLHQAWDRLIESGWEPELTVGQKSEFDRRLNNLDANPQSAVSLEKLIDHMRRQR
jgi:putative addiction module component (TIGR02574 family)